MRGDRRLPRSRPTQDPYRARAPLPERDPALHRVRVEPPVGRRGLQQPVHRRRRVDDGELHRGRRVFDGGDQVDPLGSLGHRVEPVGPTHGRRAVAGRQVQDDVPLPLRGVGQQLDELTWTTRAHRAGRQPPRQPQVRELAERPTRQRPPGTLPVAPGRVRPAVVALPHEGVPQHLEHPVDGVGAGPNTGGAPQGRLPRPERDQHVESALRVPEGDHDRPVLLRQGRDPGHRTRAHDHRLPLGGVLSCPKPVDEVADGTSQPLRPPPGATTTGLDGRHPVEPLPHRPQPDPELLRDDDGAHPPRLLPPASPRRSCPVPPAAPPEDPLIERLARPSTSRGPPATSAGPGPPRRPRALADQPSKVPSPAGGPRQARPRTSRASNWPFPGPAASNSPLAPARPRDRPAWAPAPARSA